ncbi:UDP-galactose translocator [Trichinella pseudospiralis]
MYDYYMVCTFAASTAHSNEIPSFESLSDFNCCSYRGVCKTYFFCAPYEMLKMSIPSICYAVQNNLEFYGLANMNAATYVVMAQFKVVTTAIFMVLLLGRSFSCRRWIAIFLVSIGVSMAYLGTVNGKMEDYKEAIPLVVEENAPKQSLLIGLSVVTINCFLAGFAGVYCEVMLKNSNVSLWIRNMQLYTCGLISAAIACWLTQSNEIKTFGFFHGYNALIFLIAGLQSAGGLYVSMIKSDVNILNVIDVIDIWNSVTNIFNTCSFELTNFHFSEVSIWFTAFDFFLQKENF